MMFCQLFSQLRRIPVIIYDALISTFLTISAHLIMLQHISFSSQKESLLDVGCGTGAPLHRIYPELQKHYSRIVGIDLHPQYTKQAIKLFQHNKDVEIHNMDFYKLKEHTQDKFDVILFSFSFMLMPNPLKALEVATKALSNSKSAKICFLLTLNTKASPILNRIKPLIRRVTTIDFGNVIYQDQFRSVIEEGNMKVTKKIRIQNNRNLLLMLFPVYYVECQPK